MAFLPPFDTVELVRSFGEVYSVSLHGVYAFNLTAIFDSGGNQVQLYSGEVVIEKAAISYAVGSDNSLTAAHTIKIDDVWYKPYGAPILDGQGMARQALIKE